MVHHHLQLPIKQLEVVYAVTLNNTKIYITIVVHSLTGGLMGMVMVDITEPAMKWVKFIKEELAIDTFPIDLALMIYNKEYIHIQTFLNSMDIVPSDYEQDNRDFYLYDFIFENIEEHLSDSIDDILNNNGSELTDVKVICDDLEDTFIAYGYFKM